MTCPGRRRVAVARHALVLYLLLPLVLARAAAAQISGQVSGRIHYTISATLSANGEIQGTADLTLPAGLPGAGEPIRLRTRAGAREPLLLTRVEADGRAATYTASRDSSEATLRLDRRAADRPLTIRLAWRVTADSVGLRQLGYYLFGSMGSENAWYPVVLGVPDSLARFADFDVTITAPREVALLTSGAPADSAPAGAGILRRFTAARLEGFALAFGPALTIQSFTLDGFTVSALSPPAEAATFKEVALAASRAAAWYRKTYGFFPVRSIGIVPGSPRSRGGFPMPNLFMIHRGDLSAGFVRWITAHELAHYYWGLYVLGAGERLSWLMLGLGIWTDQLYLARSTPMSPAAAWRDPGGDNSFEEFARAQIAGYDQRLDLAPAAADSLDYDYNSLVRHAKGATGVYLLALRLGEERFLALQKQLLADHAYRPLSTEELGARLEQAGVPDARGFLRAWARGDASLGYRVRAVESDSGSAPTYTVQVERTGTIGVPVTVEARSVRGDTARAVLPGQAEVDSARLHLSGRLEEVRIDPEGLLPMWSSDNLEMRRVFLRAMGAAGPTEPFLTLAAEHLRRDPDPHVAAAVVERLFETGRFERIAALIKDYPAARSCRDRVTCLAALQVARAFLRTGARTEAAALLAELEPLLARYGVSASRRLQTLRQELGR